jgi:hypothetical protein
MNPQNKELRPVGTDGTDHAYRQKIVDRYKAAAKCRSYLNGLLMTAIIYYPTVILLVIVPKHICENRTWLNNIPEQYYHNNGTTTTTNNNNTKIPKSLENEQQMLEIIYDIHNIPVLLTNFIQFLVVIICAHAARQVPSKERRVIKLSYVLIILGIVNVFFGLIVVRFREHADVVDHKKVAWVGASSIEKVTRKLIGSKRIEKLGIKANKIYPVLAQLEVFGEIMSLLIPIAIRGMAKALLSHGAKSLKSN